MKKMLSICLLLILSVFTFGQQALWSTVERDNFKYIPYENVTKEVLEFYDLYKYYFDLTGFNKETFKEKFVANNNVNKEDWDWINKIEESVVFAARAPIEGGSAIFVYCMDRNNIHVVVFSNVFDGGANDTYNGGIEKERERFIKWFKTLLNLTNSKSEGLAGGTGNQGVTTGSVDSKNRVEGSRLGTQGNISYDFGGRGSQFLPKPNYDSQEEGMVVVEVSVDRSGKVIQAIPGIKGSTTLDQYLLKVAKEAALKARFEARSDAPAVQKGTITYNFMLR